MNNYFKGCDVHKIKGPKKAPRQHKKKLTSTPENHPIKKIESRNCLIKNTRCENMVPIDCNNQMCHDHCKGCGRHIKNEKIPENFPEISDNQNSSNKVEIQTVNNNNNARSQVQLPSNRRGNYSMVAMATPKKKFNSIYHAGPLS